MEIERIINGQAQKITLTEDEVYRAYLAQEASFDIVDVIEAVSAMDDEDRLRLESGINMDADEFLEDSSAVSRLAREMRVRMDKQDIEKETAFWQAVNSAKERGGLVTGFGEDMCHVLPEADDSYIISLAKRLRDYAEEYDPYFYDAAAQEILEDEEYDGEAQTADEILIEWYKESLENAEETTELIKKIQEIRSSISDETEMAFVRKTDELLDELQALRDVLENEADTADFVKVSMEQLNELSYKDQFRIVLVMEFPETMENMQLQEDLYQDFMESDESGFFSREFRAAIAKEIEQHQAAQQLETESTDDILFV